MPGSYRSHSRRHSSSSSRRSTLSSASSVSSIATDISSLVSDACDLRRLGKAPQVAERRAIDQLLSDVVADLEHTCVSGEAGNDGRGGDDDITMGVHNGEGGLENHILIPDEMRDYLEQQAKEQSNHQNRNNLADTFDQSNSTNQQAQPPRYDCSHSAASGGHQQGNLQRLQDFAGYHGNEITSQQPIAQVQPQHTPSPQHQQPAYQHNVLPHASQLLTNSQQSYSERIPNTALSPSTQILPNQSFSNAPTSAQMFSDTSEYIPSLRTPQNSSGYPQVSSSFQRCRPPQHIANCQCHKDAFNK